MIDLIETQRIKDAIQQTPENVQQIIETTDLGICITDENGIFAAVNEKYTIIYGYQRQELIGKHFSIVVPDEKQAQLKSLHDKFIKDKLEILREWEVVNKSGERLAIEVDTGFSDLIFTKRPHKITIIQIAQD
jgi:PAS domain S-box-containing protein